MKLFRHKNTEAMLVYLVLRKWGASKCRERVVGELDMARYVVRGT